jgi:two-component system, OmpR family, response regulator
LTKRILVVDDEPTIRDLVSDALREAGYQVDAAANGAEALRIMRRRVPHAIVLDLMMPRLDATGFVEMQRLNPRLAGIPILVVTAAYGAHEAAERLGADACLTKPFELDDLVNAIDRLVGNARPEHTPEASTPKAGLQPSTVAPR